MNSLITPSLATRGSAKHTSRRAYLCMRVIGESISGGSRWSGWLESTSTTPATSEENFAVNMRTYSPPIERRDQSARTGRLPEHAAEVPVNRERWSCCYVRLARVAPSLSGTVVPANCGELCDLRLHLPPAITAVTATSRFQDHGWVTGAPTVDVQATTSDIDRAPNPKSMLAVLPSADLFVREPQGCYKEKRKCEASQGSPHPMCRWRTRRNFMTQDTLTITRQSHQPDLHPADRERNGPGHGPAANQDRPRRFRAHDLRSRIHEHGVLPSASPSSMAKGILRYRGYPIEELAEKCTFPRSRLSDPVRRTARTETELKRLGRARSPTTPCCTKPPRSSWKVSATTPTPWDADQHGGGALHGLSRMPGTCTTRKCASCRSSA